MIDDVAQLIESRILENVDLGSYDAFHFEAGECLARLGG